MHTYKSGIIKMCNPNCICQFYLTLADPANVVLQYELLLTYTENSLHIYKHTMAINNNIQ